MIKNHQNSPLDLARLASTALLCVAMLSGCDKKQQPAPAAQTTPSPAVVQQPKPVQKPVSSSLKITPAVVNQFDFSTKKDPFKPSMLIKIQTSEEQLKKSSASMLPIHSYDVSQFKLIGVVVSAKDKKAMVTDPTGKGYVLKVGMTIGKNEGSIISIQNNAIEVLEQFRDDNGKLRKETIKLTLPRKY